MPKSFLEIAESDESVCDLANAKGDCSRWIVTTAFYSALHYVDRYLFPQTVNSRHTGKSEVVNNLDEFVYHVGRPKALHEIRVSLFNSKSGGHAAVKAFQDLLGLSMSNRYSQGEPTQAEVDTARARLAEVKAFCTAPVAPAPAAPTHAATPKAKRTPRRREGN